MRRPSRSRRSSARLTKPSPLQRASFRQPRASARGCRGCRGCRGSRHERGRQHPDYVLISISRLYMIWPRHERRPGAGGAVCRSVRWIEHGQSATTLAAEHASRRAVVLQYWAADLAFLAGAALGRAEVWALEQLLCLLCVFAPLRFGIRVCVFADTFVPLRRKFSRPNQAVALHAWSIDIRVNQVGSAACIEWHGYIAAAR